MTKTGPTHTWALMLGTHARLLAAMEKRLKDAGLPSLEWYDVLWALEQAPEQRLRMHALAERLLLTRFNATRLVDRLEREGLVTRHKSKDDRRGADAVLTAKGRALRARMWPVYRAAIDELFNRHLTEAQHLGLQLTLSRLLEQDPPPG
jgi:DNA-binding MarR family transcriptional regulator